MPTLASVLAPENSDKSISELIEFVKDLEKHVVIVCQRSQQQDASGGSFEKTVSYLQQLDKKLHIGKVHKTRVVTSTLAHLKGRIEWAQVRFSIVLAVSPQCCFPMLCLMLMSSSVCRHV